MNIDMENDGGEKIKVFSMEDIEDIVNYAINEWTSPNERNQPDHADLRYQWMNNELKSFLMKKLLSK